MANTVFIMGAGASYKAGVPLMKDFLDEARKLYANNLIRETDRPHFERVFRGINALQATHSKSSLDMYNLESVFATFEMAKRLNKMPDFEPEEIDDLIHSMKRLIVVTIEEKLVIPFPKQKINIPFPYNQFGTLIQKIHSRQKGDDEVSILTFNYDIALDLMLSQLRLGPEYCLINSPSYHKGSAVKLLKLHGSINWGIVEIPNKKKDKVEHRIRPLTIQEYVGDNWPQFGEKDLKFQMGTHLKNFTKEIYLDEPVIVPPTWNKSTIHDDMLDVWREASNQLEKADNIFVIGFSMPETDIFFKHLYSLGTVGSVPLNRFWVFNPDNSGETEKRYRDLLGVGAESRFDYKEYVFEKAIVIIDRLY